MKKIAVLNCILFFGICCPGAGPSNKPFIHALHKGAQAMMTFRIVDDNGSPVSDANIETGFDDPSPGQSIYNWQTDTNGICVVNGKTRGNMWYKITKSGFYQTDGRCYFRSKIPSYVVDGKWNPWNPTNQVVLNPIKNPVPMYVKKVETMIPVLDKPVGFDLEKGDWVSPYGDGERSDFLFAFSYTEKPHSVQDNYEIEMTLGFSCPCDGIQDVYVSEEKWAAHSALRLPYFAPPRGYESVYRWNMTRTNMKRKRNPEHRDDQNYIFRIRTEVDENGEITSASYGKIHGIIQTGGYLQTLPRLSFFYYLNPTPNDRNVEFDPEKNLFGGRAHFAP